MTRQWADLTPATQSGIVILAAIQIVLAVAAWIDLARRPRDAVVGRKWIWAVVILLNFIGPIAYFGWGRKSLARS